MHSLSLTLDGAPAVLSREQEPHEQMEALLFGLVHIPPFFFFFKPEINKGGESTCEFVKSRKKQQ